MSRKLFTLLMLGIVSVAVASFDGTTYAALSGNGPVSLDADCDCDCDD